MSRIHEALKRAEQERAASQPAPNGERQAEHAVASSVIETAPPPSQYFAKGRYASSPVPRMTEAEPVPTP